MTMIRVEPARLRASASVMVTLQGDVNDMSGDALSATAGAPSYDGQFGPEVRAIGQEASSRLRSFAGVLGTRNDYLVAKADAFEAADQAVVSGLSQIPLFALPPWITFQIEIPQWLKDAVAFIISMFPGGDLVDIIPQLWNMLRGEEVDDLVLTLAVIGLLMDLGYIDPIPAEEVGNAGAALFKLIAKKIPKGPARDAIAKAFKAILENTDKLPKFVEVFTHLVGRSKVLTALAEKHPELFAKLLNSSPEAMERMLKHSDDDIVKYLDEIAGQHLGRISIDQGLEISALARRYQVDIHLAGKLADSEGEAALREYLAKRAADLAKKEGIPFVEAQLRVAERYHLDFFQVKVSSPGDVIKDVDFFVDSKQWNMLSEADQLEVRKKLAETFNLRTEKGLPDVNSVDPYQELDPLDPLKEGFEPGRYDIPDPATNVPKGSIHFAPDGTIVHPRLGNLQAAEEYLKDVLMDMGIDPSKPISQSLEKIVQEFINNYGMKPPP